MGICNCSCCHSVQHDSNLLYSVTFPENEIGIYAESDANGNKCFVAKCVSEFAKQNVVVGSQIVAINGNRINNNEKFNSINKQLSDAKTAETLTITFKRQPTVELQKQHKAPSNNIQEQKTTDMKEEDEHIIRIDFFNTIAIEVIKYKIAPFLHAYQQIGLSRLNNTFYTLFRTKTFDCKTYASFDSQYWSEHFAIYTKDEHKGFMTKYCTKVGNCPYKQFSTHEIKMFLYFFIFYVVKIKGLHLWDCNWKQFFPTFLFHLRKDNRFEYITFSNIFSDCIDFQRNFIQPFYLYNKVFSRLTQLNLDFNNIGEANGCNLFEKCIIPAFCPRLEELNISHTHISDRVCKEIYNFYNKNVKKRTKLNRIILNDNYDITSKGVDELNKIFKCYYHKEPLNSRSTAFEIKNMLNRRNWRLYSPSWHKCIITGYKPPPPKPKPKPRPTYTSSRYSPKKTTDTKQSTASKAF
eukprot:401167_1